MGRKVHCASFFATLKAELIEGRIWRTRAEAAPAIFDVDFIPTAE